ncbi:protein of unknown function [Lachnospiraceae bacterium]|nr:protein of unknown function [Lachnospiraceae bacterium]
MDTRIYVITHKDCLMPSGKGYIPLQVGAELHNALPYEKDNRGEGISEKNDTYCELTGMYWIWKNVHCDNVGICHYRRYYSDAKAERILRKDEIEGLLKKYDVITAWPQVMQEPVYTHFVVHHRSDGLDLCRKVIKEVYSDYLDCFDKCMQDKLMTCCNMMITRKELFDSYCSWLFSILFKVEKELHPEQYTDSYQRRVMGFLGERLMRVWIMMQQVRVREIRMVQSDSPDSRIPYGKC